MFRCCLLFAKNSKQPFLPVQQPFLPVRQPFFPMPTTIFEIAPFIFAFVDVCLSRDVLISQIRPEIPGENACLIVFALGTVALSRSASSAASLMSGFGQLLRQAPTGSVFTLLTLSKDSTINVRFHPSSLIPEYNLGNLFFGPHPQRSWCCHLSRPYLSVLRNNTNQTPYRGHQRKPM